MRAPARAMGDDLTDLALIGLGVLLGPSTVLRVAGGLAAWVTGAAAPTGGALAGLGVLAHPADPGTVLGSDDLHPMAYWATCVVLLGVLGAAAWLVGRAVAGMSPRQARTPHHTPGTATRRDVAHAASERTLLKRSGTLRPSLRKPTASQVGYQLGPRTGMGCGPRLRTRCSSWDRRARVRVCTWWSTRSWTPPAPWSRPRPGPTR